MEYRDARGVGHVVLRGWLANDKAAAHVPEVIDLIIWDIHQAHHIDDRRIQAWSWLKTKDPLRRVFLYLAVANLSASSEAAKASFARTSRSAASPVSDARSRASIEFQLAA